MIFTSVSVFDLRLTTTLDKTNKRNRPLHIKPLHYTKKHRKLTAVAEDSHFNKLLSEKWHQKHDVLTTLMPGSKIDFKNTTLQQLKFWLEKQCRNNTTLRQRCFDIVQRHDQKTTKVQWNITRQRRIPAGD